MTQRIHVGEGLLYQSQSNNKSWQMAAAVALLIGTGIFLLHKFGLLTAHEQVTELFTGIAVGFIICTAIYLMYQSLSSVTMGAATYPPETTHVRQAPSQTELVDPPKEIVDRATRTEGSAKDSAVSMPQSNRTAPDDSGHRDQGRTGSPFGPGGGRDTSRHTQEGKGGPPASAAAPAKTGPAIGTDGGPKKPDQTTIAPSVKGSDGAVQTTGLVLAETDGIKRV